MIDPNRLVTTKRKTLQYPDRVAVVCDMLREDNTKYETEVLEEEVELALYLKMIFPKLKTGQRTKLLKLIDNYGDMRYEDGDFDASCED